MADADDTAPGSSTRGDRSGPIRRPGGPSSDPRVDGPATPRPAGRSGRSRPNSVRHGADPLAGVGGNGAGATATSSPATSSSILPAPPVAVSGGDGSGGGEPGTGGWAEEWTTGEVATTTLDPPVTYDSSSPHGRPEPTGFGSSTGRTRNRPSSVSGRVPIITPATPFDPPSSERNAPQGAPIEIREAMPDLALTSPPQVAPMLPSVLVARRGELVGLPSAELLATLVEHEPMVVVVAEPEPEMLPVSAARATRSLPVLIRRRPRKRVRRVTRVLRHIDTWSVFKVALVFNVVLYVVCLTAGVLLWNVAYTTGTIDNIEKFFEQFGWSSFQFKGGEIFHNAWVGGLFATIGLTGLAVLLATLFNLITDLVGGVRMSVLEEEVVARMPGGEVTVVKRKRPRDRALRPLERLESTTPAAPSGARRTSLPRFMRRPPAAGSTAPPTDLPPG